MLPSRINLIKFFKHGKAQERNPIGGREDLRHTFRLDEQQQMQFENMMLKAGEPNKSKFIVGRIFG